MAKNRKQKKPKKHPKFWLGFKIFILLSCKQNSNDYCLIIAMITVFVNNFFKLFIYSLHIFHKKM